MKHLRWFLLLCWPVTLFAADKGWTVAIDPTSHAVVGYSYGVIVMVDHPLTVTGVPSLVIEQNPKYLAWHDTNLDGIPTTNEIEPMTTAEKTALDAPEVAEAQRQATFDTEISTNDLCASDLADLNNKIDTAIDSATTVGELKSALKVGLKKIVRCMRAIRR